MFGTGSLYLAVYGWTGWTPTWFVRELGWTYPQIGKLLGVILTVAGPVGGAWLAGRWRQQGIASTGMVYGGSPAVSVAFLALGAVFSFTIIGVGPLIIQETAPAPMRGQIAAFFTAVLNIVGAGLGPVAFGMITDYVLGDASAIGTAAPDRAGSGCRSPSPPWISRPSAFDPRSIRS